MLEKYLVNYAEPLQAELISLRIRVNHAVVIPSYKEPVTALLSMYESLLNQSSSILILVLNEPDPGVANEPHESREILQHSQDCINWLRADFSLQWHSESKRLQLFQAAGSPANCCVLLVNCYAPQYRIAEKHGVGLARKLGADVAAKLIAIGVVQSPWIFNTDADVQLPDNYFSAVDQAIDARPAKRTASTAAITLPFEHLRSNDSQLDKAQAFYDLRLHYQYAALRWAGSPYAYRPIGSCLVINAHHYARVRGFPKRSAGEDFHILNKLAKTGVVLNPSQPIIGIETRRSQRTPFGTGTALNDIMQLEQAERDYLYYHPEIFAELKRLLEQFENLWRTPEPVLEKVLEKVLDPNTLLALAQLRFSSAVAKAKRNSATASVFEQHMHTWFDGLKTLRFIHLLRDCAYPSLNAQALWENLPTELASALRKPLESN